MVQTAVGIKCPECAGQATGVRGATKRARAAAGEGGGLIVTKTLIAVNVAVFLLEVAQGGATDAARSEAFLRGALYGPAVADGEWYRMITSGFLHVNLIHIGFNMLMLWWFGGPLEALLGRARFLVVYALSLVAGAAGALLLSPDVFTVGASGAVFGILGAGFILERRGIAVFGGAALGVIVLNLALSLFLSNISLGGHLGGLAGGMLAVLALMHFSRGHPAYSRIDAVTVLGLVGILAGSVLVAYLRVRGYA
jgi:membrane associated rhomboid family serine protease